MSNKQTKAICDFSHDVIMKAKQLLGIESKPPSLLCHSVVSFTESTWLQSVINNGRLREYEVT
jgi:hypothetical protein